jgi:hypothetical protein
MFQMTRSNQAHVSAKTTQSLRNIDHAVLLEDDTSISGPGLQQPGLHSEVV